MGSGVYRMDPVRPRGIKLAVGLPGMPPWDASLHALQVTWGESELLAPKQGATRKVLLGEMRGMGSGVYRMVTVRARGIILLADLPGIPPA